jgi:hypothetical protein
MTQYSISRSDSNTQCQRSCLVSFLRPDTTLPPRALTSETATAATTTSNNREEEGGSRRGGMNSCCCRPSQEGRGRHSTGSHHGMEGTAELDCVFVGVFCVCCVCVCVCVCVMIRQRPPQRPRHQDRPQRYGSVACLLRMLVASPRSMFLEKKKERRGQA